MTRESGWSRTRSSCALGPTGASGSGPAAPNRLTKGRVERPVSSIRKNFFYGRDFGSDEEFSARMLRWLETEANVRVHGTLKERPADRLDRESQHLSDSLTRQQRKRRQTAAWTPDLPMRTSKATNPKGDRNVHGRTVWRRCHRCIGRLRRAGYVDGSEGVLRSPHGRVTFPLTLLQGNLPEYRSRITGDFGVGGHQDHPVQDRLRHQTPVERIGMMRRQASVVSCARLVEGQRFNLQFLSLLDHIAFARIG